LDSSGGFIAFSRNGEDRQRRPLTSLAVGRRQAQLRRAAG
jgi:hypothetical protein